MGAVATSRLARAGSVRRCGRGVSGRVAGALRARSVCNAVRLAGMARATGHAGDGRRCSRHRDCGLHPRSAGPWDRLLDGGWDVGLRPPAALGVEGAGRVLAVGADVGEVAVGDRVFAHEAPLPGGSGFWAERVLLTAAHAAACPSGLDSVEAAALPVNGLTAWQALAMLGLGRRQRLLVTNGGGATGSLAVQLAAARASR